MLDSAFLNQDSHVLPSQRSIHKVPFVELFNGRLQGVVSSSSDIKRVYVSYFEARSLDFFCSTNNNRPCGGLGGAPCKHLQSVMQEACAQYGVEHVARVLQVSGEPKTYQEILSRRGAARKDSVSDVFSRFLAYLGYLELPAVHQPLLEMHWFV
jgi:hypothetical protein